MVETANTYRQIEPGVQIHWEARSLQEFGSFSVPELAERYDLLVIDHPHLGDATRAGALLPLDLVLLAEELVAAAWESSSVNEMTDGFFSRTRLSLERSWLRPRSLGCPQWRDLAGDLVHAYLRGYEDESQTATELSRVYELVVGV